MPNTETIIARPKIPQIKCLLPVSTALASPDFDIKSTTPHKNTTTAKAIKSFMRGLMISLVKFEIKVLAADVCAYATLIKEGTSMQVLNLY